MERKTFHLIHWIDGNSQAEIRERGFQIEASTCKGLGMRTEHRADSWGAGTQAVARSGGNGHREKLRSPQ